MWRVLRSLAPVETRMDWWMCRLSGPLVTGIQRPSVLCAQIARFGLEARREASCCSWRLVMTATACAFPRTWPVMRGRPEGLLVAGRGLGAAARALVEKLGCASGS